MDFILLLHVQLYMSMCMHLFVFFLLQCFSLFHIIHSHPMIVYITIPTVCGKFGGGLIGDLYHFADLIFAVMRTRADRVAASRRV